MDDRVELGGSSRSSVVLSAFSFLLFLSWPRSWRDEVQTGRKCCCVGKSGMGEAMRRHEEAPWGAYTGAVPSREAPGDGGWAKALQVYRHRQRRAIQPPSCDLSQLRGVSGFAPSDSEWGAVSWKVWWALGVFWAGPEKPVQHPLSKCCLLVPPPPSGPAWGFSALSAVLPLRP